jgi:hypothetical protein
MSSKIITWENLLDDNPKEILVEQFLWSVDVTTFFSRGESSQEAMTVKDTLFNW